MTKGKKITLWVCVGAMILILVFGTILGVVIHNNKATVYGIEYKILQSDIDSVRDAENGYVNADMNLHITLRNKTDKDFIFNPDALYINVTWSDKYKEGRIIYNINGKVTFANGKTSLCYSDLISSIQTVPTDNAICSMKASLRLKMKDTNQSSCKNLIKTINFSVTYNGEKVLDFKPIY